MAGWRSPPDTISRMLFRTLLAFPFVLLSGGCRPKQVTFVYEWDDPHTFTHDEDVPSRRWRNGRFPTCDGCFHSCRLRSRFGSARTSTSYPRRARTVSNSQPNVIVWQVDASRAEGVAAIARAQLRPTLFHELHHLVRAKTIDSDRLRDHMIREGLGTAFERDYGGGDFPPWATYRPEVSRWTTEVLALPDDAPRAVWLFEHPDGRGWIGFRVGTYLVDRAMKSSGKTSAELVQVPTDTIVTMGLAL